MLNKSLDPKKSRGTLPFVVVLVLLAAIGGCIGFVLARHPRVEWFKLLNIIGLTYDLLGILVLSEIAINSERITYFFVSWVAGVLLWSQTVIPLGAIVGSWLNSDAPSSSVVAQFFAYFFVCSLLPLGLLDTLVFNHEARARSGLAQRSRVFGLWLLAVGTLVQLIAAFRDLHA